MTHKDSLRKKLGQLMVFGFSGKEATAEIKTLIHDHHVGGIIFFGRNIGSPEEVKRLTTELQLEAKAAGHKHPLLICIDQENGGVRRLGKGTTNFPGAMTLGATQNPQLAYQTGLATGKELKALGINWNLSPIVDVNNNPFNPVIGVRSFGEDAEQVATLTSEMMKGMQAAGVMTTLKHFPGHGDTDLDSHLELPTISHDLERLHEVELIPFKQCIAEGPDTLMSAHIYFPALEKEYGIPATLSSAVINGLLRKELGYEGVVTTDCMEMNAIADTVGTAQGAVKAIQAGIDLVMISNSHNVQQNSIETLVNAVREGDMHEQLIDQSVSRVERLKEKYLRWEDILEDSRYAQMSSDVGSLKHQQLAVQGYREGVTLVKNKDHTLPLSQEEDRKILVVYPENTYLQQVENSDDAYVGLGQVVQGIHPTADEEMIISPLSADKAEYILRKAMDYDVIIFGTLTAAQMPDQLSLLEKMYHTGKKMIVIAMRSPYDLAYVPDISAYIATYEFTTSALEAAVKAIFGHEEVSGSLPVTMPRNV